MFLLIFNLEIERFEFLAVKIQNKKTKIAFIKIRVQ